MEAQLGAWRQRSQRRLLRQRVATRPGDGGSHGRLVATVGRDEVWRRWVEGGARPGDDGLRWRRAGGRLGSGRGCAKEAAVPEGHGEAWRRRSRRTLDDGPDVGS